jgi:hypothetical protein
MFGNPQIQIQIQIQKTLLSISSNAYRYQNLNESVKGTEMSILVQYFGISPGINWLTT